MAGPSVVVRVLGDVTGLAKSFGTAVSKGSDAAKGLHNAFQGVLSTLNSAGVLGPFGEALATVDESLEKIKGHAKDIGPAMMGVGGALAGIGLAFTAMGSKDQAAHQQLQASVEATGHSYDEYEKQVEAAVKSQEKYGHTANQTQDALRLLTQATHDPAKALALLSTASNVAAAKHEDLTAAAGQVGKVFNGNKKLLKEYGIVIDSTTGKTKDGRTATQALAEVTAGQATAAADTFGGHITAIKAHLEDVAATMGQKYGPAVSAVGAIMAGMGGAVTAATGVFKSLQGVMKTQQAVTEGVTVAQDAEAVSAWLALGPLLLIIAAVAALVAIGYVIYRNWTTIWGAIKKAVKAVWDWIKDNWPLLVGILLGPIGIAAALIYKYWDTVKKDAKAVTDFITGIWNDLVGFFTAIPAALSKAASGLWDFIEDQAKTVYKDVVGVWNGLVRWLTGLPAAVLRTLSGLWNFLYNQANTVYGWVIGVWNAMIRWLTGLPGAVLRTLSGLWNFIYN
jgi:phage-related protein